MKTIEVKLGKRSYPIWIGKKSLEINLKNAVSKYKQLLIVTNTIIEKLYLEETLTAVKDENKRINVLILEDGEKYKTIESLNSIFEKLLIEKFNRSCCLVALGGGVVGDITGFGAACYQRGVDFIQIPTTLLAQVDSSVGGKTAVNHKLGKNMIGAFHQPVSVIADTDVLKTLPERELSAGLAEVIKYGLIRDKEFYEWLKSNIEKLIELDESAMMYAIERSCKNKAEVVAADEKESNIRAILNLGHTFGHAIETAMNYKGLLHGEAVACGMLMAAHISMLMKQVSVQEVEQLKQLLIKARLPVKIPAGISADEMINNMRVDKKNIDDNIRLVLLKSIGHAYVTSDYSKQDLSSTIGEFLS